MFFDRLLLGLVLYLFCVLAFPSFLHEHSHFNVFFSSDLISRITNQIFMRKKSFILANYIDQYSVNSEVCLGLCGCAACLCFNSRNSESTRGRLCIIIVPYINQCFYCISYQLHLISVNAQQSLYQNPHYASCCLKLILNSFQTTVYWFWN